MIMTSIDDINALLPQTQCTRCGFDGCKPYAEAMLTGTPHNQCPPGGQATADTLAALLARPELDLNPEFGTETPYTVAVINEDDCIGCTKCIDACPVDAIVGAAKLMHTVITDECTGCDLCVQPCPVDCIEMVDAPDYLQYHTMSKDAQAIRANENKARYDKKQTRQTQHQEDEATHFNEQKWAGEASFQESRSAKKAYIEAAIARKRKKGAKS